MVWALLILVAGTNFATGILIAAFFGYDPFGLRGFVRWINEPHLALPDRAGRRSEAGPAAEPEAEEPEIETSAIA